jgi:hypothetical protein
MRPLAIVVDVDGTLITTSASPADNSPRSNRPARGAGFVAVAAIAAAGVSTTSAV